MNIKKSETAGANKIRRPARRAAASSPAHHAESSRRTTPTELSNWVEKARNLPKVRKDLVERVRAEIAAGKYETPEKIQIAAERMLEEIY